MTARAVQPSPWLPSFSADSGGLPRLFCLPFAGGSAEFYRSWQRQLAKIAVVCPVELPGRGSRSTEPFAEHIAEVVSGICESLRSYVGQPYALFGHSLGAILGMQVASMLHASGLPLPAVFIASGITPPHLGKNSVPPEDATDEMLLNEMRRMGGTPEFALQSPELINYFLPILRKDYCLARSCKPYSPVPLEMPIAVFGGESDWDAPRESLEKWQEMSVYPCGITVFPGGHFYLMDQKTVVLDQLRQELRKYLSIPSADISRSGHGLHR